MKLPSTIGGHQFSQVPSATIERSKFDRSFTLKTTFDGGLLVPIYVDEALPGDTFALQMTGFARLATPLKPTMDNLTMETFFFFVPHRLVWSNWQKFCGEQTNPGDSTSFVLPVANSPAAGYVLGTLGDYFGLPTAGTVPAITAAFSASALPFRAYNLIWNTWFRDENLQNSISASTSDGPDIGGNYALQRRGKRHDYFTSCLPFPQKGTAVTLPLGTKAQIRSPVAEGVGLQVFVDPSSVYRVVRTVTGTNPVDVVGTSVAGGQANALYADLAGATAATINQLRQAFQIQKLLERDARGGTRYTEIVRAHFGVVSPDARLQRPEYLGGGSSPVNIRAVEQTAPQQAAGVTTPQGNLAGFGTAVLQGHGFVKSFTEHGTIIGLVCVRADLTYQQGVERMWNRSTRYDFYWPALAHIGEQAVLNKEIYCDGSANDALVFGYQERYAEYRYKSSMVTGLFRSTVSGTLDLWHYAQKFTALPALNAAFIQEDPLIDRTIAVQTEPHFLFDAYFKLTCARPMPVYGVPGLIDHF